jgi:release factor glutamine methyltransferase
MEETWTILKVLRWTADYFKRHHIDQPRATAEVLLASVLGLERIGLYLHYDKPLQSEELARFREMIRRRAARVPTQYITGHQEFWSLDLEVTSAVLIPRPETELLVETALELPTDPPLSVLDLATGSGAIAIALAKERPAWTVVATDISPEALAIARRNILRHHLGDRLHLIAMNLFAGFSEKYAGFDLILANPPYIGDDEFKQLQPEVGVYEPQRALRGGGTLGLNIICRILAAAPRWLRPGGRLLLEIGMGQDQHLEPIVAADPCYRAHGFKKDYSGITRLLWATRADREPEP